MTEKKNIVQIRFFEKLRESVPANVSLADEVAGLLEISPDSAYRRIRGESVLSLGEFVKLCGHFRITPGIMTLSDDDTVIFRYRTMINESDGLGNYFNNILADLQKIYSSATKQIIYASGDLPLFVQFVYPEYAAFKVFFWQRAVLNAEGMEDKKYSPDFIGPENAEMCRKISDIYNTIPSIEIWHDDTVHSNIKIIEYAWESGMFNSKDDALMICRRLSDILLLIESQAARSSKFSVPEKWAANEGNFTMYRSEFILTNNHIFVSTGAGKILYLTHNTFNSIATSNENFCNETGEWLKNLIKKSTQISGSGEKQRYVFFRQLQNKVQALTEKISHS